jgi:hypothetical protein
MGVRTRFLRGGLTLLLLAAALAPAVAQSLQIDVVNTRREPAGRIWGAGNWMAFTVDEDTRDLNGDMDLEDSVLTLVDLRTMTVRETGIAISYDLIDSEDDWPVAFSGETIAVQVSEEDNGKRDLNGDGRADRNVLALFTPANRQFTSLGLVGSQPRFAGSRLFFIQRESDAKRDLNGDRDVTDAVLCVYDTGTRQWESLGVEAGAAYHLAGDWIAAETSELGHGAKDLNGDGDTQDTVVQLYQISQKKWTNTGLESTEDTVLTTRLLAAATSERNQGNKDLNGDGDTDDVVCQVWDVSTGQVTNTGLDCGSWLAGDESRIVIVTRESAQGNKDLNGDMDTQDEVLHVYTPGAAPVNLRYDASGGVAVGPGRVLFSCFEANQANRDQTRDGDTDDYLLLTYDTAKNRLSSTGYTVDGDLIVAENVLAWRVLEADQGDRDLNRDRDADDSVLFVMDLTTGAFSSTAHAAGEYLCPTARGVAFVVPELDQGEKDLNMDRDADDEVLHIARIGRR